MQGLPFDIEYSGNSARFILHGDLTIHNLERVRSSILDGLRGSGAVFDLSNLGHMDTAGAWLLIDFQKRLAANGQQCELSGATDAQSALLATVNRNWPDPSKADAKEPFMIAVLRCLGEAVVGTAASATEVMSLLGQVIAGFGRILIRPWKLRWTSLVHHMEDAGFDAVPIVSLMAFLIGIVLAFQGSTQLSQFGAEIFVVDLIAFSILRELGILLTAIIVAGRSSSAITAAIGSMKMQEEIDAMRTLSLDPIEVLVLPRVLALIITLPILGFIADMAGLFGGALMSWVELGISPSVFLARLNDSVDGWQFVIGIVKAPFFALTIGIVGCYMGLKVEGNAESLGQRTSQSVVVSIFLVIVLDAIFSIFFALVGV